MIGVIVNTITVIIGSIIGMLGGKLVPERVNKAVMPHWFLTVRLQALTH